MSRLYGSLDADASRTTATKRGHKEIQAHVRGWNSGVRIIARSFGDDDVFYVYSTSGSNGGAADVLIATIDPRAERMSP